MRVKIAIPESHVSKPVLDAGLEAVTRLNEQMIASGEVPSFERGLRYGVKWRPEPPGDEHFDSADRVLVRKAGDCDDLAPWHAASLRASGEDPQARAVVKRSGPKRWHAIVQRGDGSIDDPSLRAGMAAGVEPMRPQDVQGAIAARGIAGAVVPFMLPPTSSVSGSYIIRPQIAVRPVYGAHQARVDIPWQWREHMELDTPTQQDLNLTALHTAPVASSALVGAIDSAVRLSESVHGIDRSHVDRLCAIADACEGATYEQLCGIYGQEHAEAASQAVVGFFGKMFKGITKGLGKLASKAVAFVPGVGPVASMALDAGMSLAKGGGGRRRGRGSPAPATSAPAHVVSPLQPRVVPVQQYGPGVAAIEHGGRVFHLHFH